MASNQRLFASKVKFLTDLQSSPVADSNLQEFVDVFTLPEADGTSDQVLKTDGSGIITFGTVSGGGGGVDSAFVTSQINALIDGAPGALNTLNELAAAINDDSQAYNTLLSLVNAKIDSAVAVALITTTVDSAYVQLRQDYSYASLTGTPNVLDSADVALIAGGSGGGLDSSQTISLIDTTVDSAYVQFRQDYSYASLTGTPNVLDSADVALIAGGSGGGLDSSQTISLIDTTVDSAFVQSRVTFSSIFTRTTIAADSGQTVFAATYTPSYVDVFLNGVKIRDSDDFTATNGTSITLVSDPALSAGDIVEITGWSPTAVVGGGQFLTTTVDSSEWSQATVDDPWIATKTISGILSTDRPIVDLDLSSVAFSNVTTVETSWSNVYRVDASADNQMKLYATNQPTSNLNLLITVIR